MRRGHLDQQVIRGAVGRGDIDVQERVPLALGVGEASLAIVTSSRLRLTSTDLAELSARDHVRVVHAEVLAFDEERRLLSSFRRLAVPAQERGTELQALRAEDPRIVVVAAEGNPDRPGAGWA